MAKRKRENNSGSIYKDGAGFRVALKVGVDPATGQPIYKKARAKTRTEAVAQLDKLKGEAYIGKLHTSTSPTLAAYMNHWLDTRIKPMRADSTYRQYQWLCTTHILPHLGKKKLDQIQRPDVQELINLKAKQQVQSRSSNSVNTVDKLLSRSTLRLIRAVIHSAYEDAIRDNLAARNPAGHIELPREKRKPAVFLTPNEAKQLIASSKRSDIHELLLFMLTLGTRIGESLGVRWQDIDFTQRHVRICGQLQRLQGKLTRKDSTKTNQDRCLPLSHSLCEALKQLKNGQLVNGFSDPDGIVFLNAIGNRFDQKLVGSRLKEICRVAGIQEISLHKLRHTTATLTLAETGSIHAVQKLLGHQQSSLTTDLYSHASPETLRHLPSAMEMLLSSDD